MLLNTRERGVWSTGTERSVAELERSAARLGRSKALFSQCRWSLADVEQIVATPARVEVSLGCCIPVGQLARCSVLLTKGERFWV